MLLLPGYFLTDQPTDGTRFLQFWIICVLVSVIAQGQGLTMGALMPNPQVSMLTHNYANTWKWLELLYFLGFTKKHLLHYWNVSLI